MQVAHANNAKGFTLIELMITVAIIGILAAVAVPQYRSYVIKGNRAAAQAFLMDVASRQKQYLLDARTYAPDLSTLAMTVPAEVSKNYTVTVDAPTGAMPSFTVTATPISGMTNAADGALTLNEAGVKTPSTHW